MTKLTTKQEIEKVLTGQRKPMTVAQITEATLPLTNLKGATPKQVLAANIDSIEFERITNLPRTPSEENKQIKDERQAMQESRTGHSQLRGLRRRCAC